MHIAFPLTLSNTEDARKRQIPLVLNEYFDDAGKVTSLVTTRNGLLRAYNLDGYDDVDVMYLTIDA